MTSSSMDIEALLKKLDADRDAYFATQQQLYALLANNGAASNISRPAPSIVPPSPRPNSHRVNQLSASDIDNLTGSDGISSIAKTSFVSGEDEDASDDDEALYVQDPLEKTKFDGEQLRSHLRNNDWNDHSQAILKSLFTKTGRLKHENLFTAGEVPNEEGAHYSLYQVFDVGNDGTPLPLHTDTHAFKKMPKDQALWHLIKDINADPARLRQAVGRITILREPSPLVFAAIHLTMNKLFDMDEIFRHLVQQGTTTAYMKRAYDEDPRKRKSFVFSFEFFTIIGDDCHPMSWQESDRERERPEGHIPISRCSSVVALALVGNPIRKLKNAARRAKTQYGYVYSPWSPWHVLNIECYPDWKSNTGSHDSTKHYVNGPEAFLNTLLVEYKDAQKRFEEICKRIGRLITPPAEFMFNGELRDKLLFEDKDFTYSRRYFWSFQTLGTMNQSIRAMVDAYEDTFTDAVWNGHHYTLWPLTDDSSRNAYWRKRMTSLRKDFNTEIGRLKDLMHDNDILRKEITNLRDNLFSGTSVLESRKSVEQTEITVQQGQNIKLLTLVNMFFLPLTFVTSVFGMTNMPTEASFWRFGVVMACVCVPFFLLIGSMNTNRGMRFWREHVHRSLTYMWSWITWWRGKPKTEQSDNNESDENPNARPLNGRSLSASQGIVERTNQFNTTPTDSSSDALKITKGSISFDQPSSSNVVLSQTPPNIINDKKPEGREKTGTWPTPAGNAQAPSPPRSAPRSITNDPTPTDPEKAKLKESGEGKTNGLGIWRRFKAGRRAEPSQKCDV
ncbi:hypothetical protein BGZ60DRAFT_66763 [Tricladium varicosporioides]|nr:hypothetical protein BGZ60DRAFT_66763 [Hymenoscyphus varicosporioides]